MDGLSTGSQAAALIQEHKAALAGAVTSALYAEMPQLMDRYGAYGRARCLEDMHFNLEHLAAAVELGAPERFAGYIGWVDDLLTARDVRTDELARTLELTETLLAERLPPDSLDGVRECLRAGLARLGR